MSTLSDDLKEAFLTAEKHRRAGGYGSRALSEVKTTRSDGTVWYGPGAYKLTVWVAPWDYLDISRGIAASDRPDQSFDRFIKAAVKEKCDRLKVEHSARPEPRKSKAAKTAEAKILPLRRKPVEKTAVANLAAARAAQKIMHREAHG